MLRSDVDVVSVARLLAGPDADLPGVAEEIIAEVHVPHLAQLRYRGSGLLKRTVWERPGTCSGQEDRTGRRLDIPVPADYTSADGEDGGQGKGAGRSVRAWAPGAGGGE